MNRNFNGQTVLEKMAEAMGDSLSANVLYQLQNDMIKQELFERQEREKLKNEICEAVLARIQVKLEAEAISQLREMIKDLGGNSHA